jgi:hypothetical protein
MSDRHFAPYLRLVRSDSRGITNARIHAYLAAMRPRRDVAVESEHEEAYHRGRSAIEHLANSAMGEDQPELILTASQCADILCFMHYSAPIPPGRSLSENEASYLAGQNLVLEALENSLRDPQDLIFPNDTSPQ